MKERIKKWFLEPVQKNFWRDAFLLALFFNFVSPLTVVFLTIMNVGIITPELNSTAMNGTFVDVGNEIAEVFTGSLKTVFETGQGIGKDNPLMQMIVPHLMSYWVVGYYISLGILITNLLRYGIAYLHKRGKK